MSCYRVDWCTINRAKGGKTELPDSLKLYLLESDVEINKWEKIATMQYIL